MYFFFTSLSGKWVSSFKNTEDFIIWALCSDHVIGKFRCKLNGKVKRYLHTLIFLTYPTLKNDTPKSVSQQNNTSRNLKNTNNHILLKDRSNIKVFIMIKFYMKLLLLEPGEGAMVEPGGAGVGTLSAGQ